MRRTWAIVVGSALLLTGCKAAASTQDASPPAAGATPSAATPATSAGPAATPARDRTVISAGHAFPDRALTPGATFAGVTAAKVCVPGWASAHRDVTETLRHQVFAAYGIPYSAHSRYELDHLIPLELGGSNSAKNLWPEPLTDDDTSGPSKDALENHLHGLVCSGQLSLGAAQRGIAKAWLTMWNDYEHIAIHRSSTSHRSTGGSSSRSGDSSSSRSSSGGSSSGGSSTSSGATALCVDGTLSYSAHHRGTCSHHGGVRVWYK